MFLVCSNIHRPCIRFLIYWPSRDCFARKTKLCIWKREWDMSLFSWIKSREMSKNWLNSDFLSRPRISSCSQNIRFPPPQLRRCSIFCNLKIFKNPRLIVARLLIKCHNVTLILFGRTETFFILWCSFKTRNSFGSFLGLMAKWCMESV